MSATKSINYLIFSALIFVGSAALSADHDYRSCEEFLAKINSLSNLKAEFNAEGSAVVKAYYKQVKKIAMATADSFNFIERTVALQELVSRQLQKNKSFNGWNVTPLSFDGRGNLAINSLYVLLGDESELKHATGFDEKHGVLLTQGPLSVFLLTAVIDKKVVAAEVTAVVNDRKKFPKRLTFGARPYDKDFDDTLSDRSISREEIGAMTPDQRDEYFNRLLERPTGGYGTPESAEVVNRMLAKLEGQPEKKLPNETIAEWNALNDQYLQLGSNINLRGLIGQLVELHRAQQALRGDRRTSSRFYFDDRGSVITGQSFRIPSGTMKARPGGLLLNILGYVEIRMVLDVPRVNDDFVRLHVWDDRNHQWAEEYMLPLNGKAKDNGRMFTDSTFLPAIYGRLVEAVEQMEMRKNELEVKAQAGRN